MPTIRRLPSSDVKEGYGGFGDASLPILKKWATRLVKANAVEEIPKARIVANGVKEWMHLEELQDV